MHSYISFFKVKTSESCDVDTVFTAQRIDNDRNGNPRYFVQVWIVRDEGGNLWSPLVKGYRLNKKDGYHVQSYNIRTDIVYFKNCFEKAVCRR